MPGLVLIYGLLGLIPFLAPPAIAYLWPEAAASTETVLIIYAAMILSFLGGARWGLAVPSPSPDRKTVSLAMLPTLIGTALLLIPAPTIQVIGLAAALILHWLWDIRSQNLPRWYTPLRTILTAGAVTGLIADAIIVP